MSVTATDRVVSDSRLLTVLREGSTDWMTESAADRPGATLDLAYVQGELAQRWREGVRRQVKRRTKRAKGTLEVLGGDVLYADLDDPLHRRAALVAEVFRDHAVSKNAGRLDARAVQQRFAAAVREGAIELEIAWGQPKRGVGGLKTSGEQADLAEAFAVVRLGALVTAIADLAETDVRLTVLSGGGRFADALLTRPAPRADYDRQRQCLADTLAAPAKLAFREFAAERPEAGDWYDRYRSVLRNLGDADIVPRLHTVLLNVDWDNVLAEALAGRRPHGVALPSAARAWLTADPARTPVLIRAAVSAVVTPRHQAAWQGLLGEADVLEDAIAFFSAIAWEATRHYVAIHTADRGTPAAGRPGIRLSVHENRDRPDRPAVLTLGPRGGDLLSQHVTALVRPKEQVLFETVAEITVGSSAGPVRIGGSPADGLFGWLAGSAQPLCFGDAGAALGAAFDPEA